MMARLEWIFPLNGSEVVLEGQRYEGTDDLTACMFMWLFCDSETIDNRKR